MISYVNDSFVISILFMCFCLSANAQDLPAEQPKSNAIYYDVSIGPFVYHTGNYERSIRLKKSQSYDLRFRTGFLWGGMITTENDFLGIPLAGTWLWGQEKNHFEVTAGGAVGIWREEEVIANVGLFPLANIGYRFEPPGGGFIFRTTLGIGGIGLGLGWAF